MMKFINLRRLQRHVNADIKLIINYIPKKKQQSKMLEERINRNKKRKEKDILPIIFRKNQADYLY